MRSKETVNFSLMDNSVCTGRSKETVNWNFSLMDNSVPRVHHMVKKRSDQVLSGGGNGRLCRVSEKNGEWDVQEVIYDMI